MEYDIVHVNHETIEWALRDLITRVNACIAQGWHPIGGISVQVIEGHSWNDRFWCSQAIVRTNEVEKEGKNVASHSN